jgi:hypothetical protein
MSSVPEDEDQGYVPPRLPPGTPLPRIDGIEFDATGLRDGDAIIYLDGVITRLPQEDLLDGGFF